MSMLRAGAASLAVAVALGGLALQAHAQDRDYRHPPRRHVVHHPPPRPDWGYAAPAYVAAPPPVVYAPPAPPPLVVPAPGLSVNLSIPLR